MGRGWKVMKGLQIMSLNDVAEQIKKDYDDARLTFVKSARIHTDIECKLAEIKDKYQDYPSYQHAAWIIEEEYREFCAELFKKDSEWDYTKIYKELIDIMAACYRTIIDRDLLSHVKASAENTEES